MQEPKEVRENSIVLVRNIGNEPKREPLKIARIEKIHASRDDAQRVVTLTYNNVRINKDGEWIGTPIRVERSINDLVIVDNALNDSMLNPRMLRERYYDENKHNKMDASGHDEKVEDDHENEERNDNHEMHEEAKISNHEDETNKNEETGVRKSSRIQKRRMIITDDEIGDCDDENDPDYIR